MRYPTKSNGGNEGNVNVLHSGESLQPLHDGNKEGNGREASSDKADSGCVTTVTPTEKGGQLDFAGIDNGKVSEIDNRFLKLVGERYGKDTHSDSDFLSVAKDAGYDLGDERHQKDALKQILNKLTGLGAIGIVQGGRHRLAALPAKDVGGE